MKKVGFIHLYGNDLKTALSTNNGFQYTIYIFNEAKSGFELYKSTEDLSSESLKGIEHFYLSLPAEVLDFRILEFPFSDEEKLRKVIPFELGNLILGDIKDIAYDFTILESSGNTYTTLVAYVDKKIIKGILEEFRSKDIDIYAITSLQLSRILEGKKGDIAMELTSPQMLSEEDKIKTAIKEIKACSINLRTGEFVYTKDIKKSGRMFKLMLVLLICLAIIVNANLAFRIVTTKNEISYFKEQTRTIYSSIFPADKKIVDELYQMKSHMKNLRGKADILIGVNPLDLMVNLSGVKPNGIVFEEINHDRDVITMKGEAVSMGDLDALKKSFSEIYHNVSISDIKPLSESKILFTLIIKDMPL